MMNAPFYPFLISTIIIAGNLFVGAILFYRNWRFVNNALVTTGTVIELKKRGTTKGGNPMYSPVVRFVGADGVSAVEFTEFIRRHPPAFEVGERVTIFYDRRDFQKARVVKSSWDLYFPAWIFFLVGGALLVCQALVAIILVMATMFLGKPGVK
jgi:hypothetical protein